MLGEGWSRPSRTRGLKLGSRVFNCKILESRPSRTRGLKREANTAQAAQIVASLADAWIETITKVPFEKCYVVASLADAWIETHQELIIWLMHYVASLADAWIETRRGLSPLCTAPVASLADAWIETGISPRRRSNGTSRPSRTRGLKL